MIGRSAGRIHRVLPDWIGPKFKNTIFYPAQGLVIYRKYLLLRSVMFLASLTRYHTR